MTKKYAILLASWHFFSLAGVKLPYSFVYSLGGCLSGEHGIGLRKLAEMKKFTDPVELGMMEAIKKALDPNLILNPAKIFDFGD